MESIYDPSRVKSGHKTVADPLSEELCVCKFRGLFQTKKPDFFLTLPYFLSLGKVFCLTI